MTQTNPPATAIDYGHVATVVHDALTAQGYRRNACILAARMIELTFERLGIPGVEAVACHLRAMSPIYVQMRQQIGDRRPDEGEVDAWMARGAWAVEISDSPPAQYQLDHRDRTGYHGHVVTLVDRRWLIDPTISQVDRPAKDIVIDPPYAWEIDYEDACEYPGAIRSTAGGTWFMHHLLPERKDFRRAPDWRAVRRDDPMLQDVYEQLKERMT